MDWRLDTGDPALHTSILNFQYTEAKSTPSLVNSQFENYDLSITKAGSPYSRRLLIELAWRMVFYQLEYKAAKKWMPILGDAKAHRRHRKRAIVALARQLAVDIWKWQTQRATPQELAWKMTLAA